MKVMFICGTWDSIGKPSGYMAKLADYMRLDCYINGGRIGMVPGLLDLMEAYDVIYWFPNFANDAPRFVNDIKELYPKKLLITSKRNIESEGDQYTLADITAKMIRAKANLTLILSGTRGQILGSVVDPLGVYYCDDAKNIDDVARALRARVKRLLEFTRIPTKRVGPAQIVPTDKPFFDYVRKQADIFHDIIHGAQHTRMMGNASFRCTRGFPSKRQGNFIYVSRRNIDKRYIDPEHFVAVEIDPDNYPIRYYGPHKPSVDTPIQVALYRYYENIRYMVHSHTYVRDAPITKEPIPCGAMEEASAIFQLAPRSESFAVNLLGHGSIIGADTVTALKQYTWVPRPVPELFSY